jgi:glycosyltransferase involved in cell wall biosynthesis
VHCHAAWPILTRLGISPAMMNALLVAGKRIDLLHNHGAWMMPNIYAGRAALKRNRPLVFSPRGMFSEWAWGRSSRRKRLVWVLGQKDAVAAATCFHATAESEAEDIRRLGFRQPIAVVPNGVDLPPPAPETGQRGRTHRVLFLSRIHPKKGIPLLLEAWARVGPAHFQTGNWS